jgi:peptidyl-prolyl cis-trans isomerase SurA
VAIVGDTAILNSELQEYVFRLQAQGVEIPQDPEQLDAFLRQTLESKINQVLLVLHAEREGITVTEAEINEIVDDQIARVQRNFRSMVEYEQALASEGITSAEFRIRLTEQARGELIAQRYLQMRVGTVQPDPVSEEEIRDLFETQRESLGPKPASVTLKQVVIAPKPSENARRAAEIDAEEALSRARSGQDFALLAAEYSDDPGSKDNGGLLGWVRQEDMVPAFGEALFAMQVGDISDIVETTFGFHIIKLDRVRGDERSARHILITPEMTTEDADRYRQLADDIATALRAGADVDSLIRVHGDPNERASLTDFPRDRLPEEYNAALTGVSAGDVVGPVPMRVPGISGDKWIVAEIIEISAGGEWTLDDWHETMRQQLEQEKMISKIVNELREKTYIEIRFEGSPVTR